MAGDPPVGAFDCKFPDCQYLATWGPHRHYTYLSPNAPSPYGKEIGTWHWINNR